MEWIQLIKLMAVQRQLSDDRVLAVIALDVTHDDKYHFDRVCHNKLIMMVTVVQYNVYHKYVLIIRNFTFMMNITNLGDEIDNGVD